MTEITTEVNESSYKGLRVLDHPTSMYNLNQTPDDDIQEEGQDTSASSHQVQDDGDVENHIFCEGDTVLCNSDSKPELDDKHGSFDVMEDSSDSEGEDEEHVTENQDTVAQYSVDELNTDVQNGVGRLTLNHPYYANTGAIPKGSASSLPDTVSAKTNSTEEVITVDVHAPREPAIQRWTSYNKYDPRSNKHFLYDVQEVEPNYGDIASASNPDGRVRDSGCSESSSRSDITDVPSFPITNGNSASTSTSCNESSSNILESRQFSNRSLTNLVENKNPYVDNLPGDQHTIEISRSNSKEYLEPRQQIQLRQQASYQQLQQQIQNSNETGEMYYRSAINENKSTPYALEDQSELQAYHSATSDKEAATYLDMDR